MMMMMMMMMTTTTTTTTTTMMMIAFFLYKHYSPLSNRLTAFAYDSTLVTIACFFFYVCTFHPGNCTGWGSEGVT